MKFEWDKKQLSREYVDTKMNCGVPVDVDVRFSTEFADKRLIYGCFDRAEQIKFAVVDFYHYGWVCVEGKGLFKSFEKTASVQSLDQALECLCGWYQEYLELALVQQRN